MGNISINIEGLSKLYRIGEPERYRTLRETLVGVGYTPFHRLLSAFRDPTSDGGKEQPPKQECIWALKDVSLQVGRGEVLGIIGPNGAGKTTLLRILSRITDPTEGQVHIHGRVGSLLEVGTGFHPELTGRDNIYLNGAILGMKQAEIGRKFDEIVAFSGVEKFIDTPVKRYSSGMYVRLAFAVAAHLDPEILLVDEVLAVGDAAFQEKCLGKINEVVTGGRTVLFVSHNMAAIRSLCSRAILLSGGQVRIDARVDDAIHMYLSDINNLPKPDRQDLSLHKQRSGSGSVRIMRFIARSCDDNGSGPSTGKDAEFLISYAAGKSPRILRLHVAIGVVDKLGNSVFGCTTTMTALRDFRDLPPYGTILCRVRKLPLIPGEYRVNLLLKDDRGLADMLNSAGSFVVRDTGDSGFMIIPSQRWGSVVVQHEWNWLPTVDQVVTDKNTAE